MSGRKFSLWGASVTEVVRGNPGDLPVRSPVVCSGPFGHRTARLEALVHQANHAPALRAALVEAMGGMGGEPDYSDPDSVAAWNRWQAVLQAYDEGCV